MPQPSFRVVICGGGVAAVEGALGLRRLLGDRLDLTILAPNKHFRYRPMAVTEPFSFGGALEVPLEKIADDVGAELVEDIVESVDNERRVVRTGSGRELPFDAVLVAVGARSVEPYEHVRTFNDAQADNTFHGVIQDLEQGYVKSIAFIAPQPPVFPLPLYELALMTAAHAREQNVGELTLSLITAEPRPLAPFGSEVSGVVSGLLETAGFRVHTLSVVHVPEAGRIVIEPDGPEIHADAIIAVPHLTGPTVSGLSHGPDGFVPIDRFCSVPEANGRVFAAGDAAEFPVKHGGLGAQMADTAANGIARLAGVELKAEPLDPVLRGKLLTGAEPLYIEARVVGGHGFDSTLHKTPPWRADDKIVANELGDYLEEIRLAA